MKYVPINEFVTLGDEVYKCIEDSEAVWCSMCDLQHSTHCSYIKCCTDERSDWTSVFFIRYDNLSGSDEPFTSEGNASD